MNISLRSLTCYRVGATWDAAKSGARFQFEIYAIHGLKCDNLNATFRTYITWRFSGAYKKRWEISKRDPAEKWRSCLILSFNKWPLHIEHFSYAASLDFAIESDAKKTRRAFVHVQRARQPVI